MCDKTHALAEQRYSKSGESYQDLEVTLEDWGTLRGTPHAVLSATLASGNPQTSATPLTSGTLNFALVAHMARVTNPYNP
jgi:hypothetical protein